MLKWFSGGFGTAFLIKLRENSGISTLGDLKMGLKNQTSLTWKREIFKI